MEPAFDQSSIANTLRKAIENGRFTLEDLDRPAPGFLKNSRPDRRTFPNGYEGVQHRNLLRGDSSPSQPHREAPQDTPKHLRSESEFTTSSDGQRPTQTPKEQIKEQLNACSQQTFRQRARNPCLDALQGDVHAE